MALAALSLAAWGGRASADETPPSTEVVISIAEQRLVVLRDGMWVGKYHVSTSKFGLGDSFGSYKTPVGKLRVCEKIGGHLAHGAVIKHRNATGEILPVNAPGRDPIVTRVLWLEGLEERNKHAKSRGIYIHGTVEEAKIGSPVSYGCIRMRSREVTDLYESVPIGSVVTVQTEKLPNYRRWTAPEPIVVAAKKPALPAPPVETPLLAKVAPPVSLRIVEKREKLAKAGKTKPAAEERTNTTRMLLTEKTKPGWKKDAEGGAAGALSGSILFADLPNRSVKPGGLESMRGPVLAPLPEISPKDPTSLADEPPPPLPRVTFRTGLSTARVP